MIKHDTRGTLALGYSFALATMLGLSGCPEDKNKAEKAGEKLEKAGDKAGGKLEKAGDKIEDKIDERN